MRAIVVERKKLDESFQTMPKIIRFEDLRCWMEARRLVKMVYEMTNSGPISTDFNVRNQIRRVALSAMSNIAEGFGRVSKREFTRFLEISASSTYEVRSITYAAVDLGYWTESEALAVHNQAERVKALNLGLINHLRSTSARVAPDLNTYTP